MRLPRKDGQPRTNDAEKSLGQPKPSVNTAGFWEKMNLPKRAGQPGAGLERKSLGRPAPQKAAQSSAGVLEKSIGQPAPSGNIGGFWDRMKLPKRGGQSSVSESAQEIAPDSHGKRSRSPSIFESRKEFKASDHSLSESPPAGTADVSRPRKLRAYDRPTLEFKTISGKVFCESRSRPKAEKPGILIIARSSDKSPRAWGETPFDFLLAHKKASWYAAYQQVTGDTRSIACTQLLYGFATRTKFVPILDPVSKEFIAGLIPSFDDTNRKQLDRFTRMHTSLSIAHQFTSHVSGFLQGAGPSPVVISIGVDGFTCNADRFKEFLDRMPRFRLVILHHTQLEGLGQVETDVETIEGAKTFFVSVFDTSDMKDALYGSTDVPGEVMALLAAWNQLQDTKDNIGGLARGRNG
jgi:hypothetical protein